MNRMFATFATQTAIVPERKIAFEGGIGSQAHLACGSACPDFESVPFTNLHDAFIAVHKGSTDVVLLPIENSVIGRVADFRHLTPQSGLRIVAEHFEPADHNLLVLPGTKIEEIAYIHADPPTLGQCRQALKTLPGRMQLHADAASAAARVVTLGNRAHAALGTKLMAELNGLEVAQVDICDADVDVTRFVIMGHAPNDPCSPAGPTITSLFFETQSLPAALYKALGGFATNEIDLLKLESDLDSDFSQARFYVEILGHPNEIGVQNALDELRFFSRSLTVIGVYQAHAFRLGSSRANRHLAERMIVAPPAGAN